MKVAGIVILAAIALAVLTGSCSGGEFFTYTGDPFTSAESGSTSTSALTSDQLPPPPPPSAAIHRAARPAVWAASVCAAMKAWDTDWKTRVREVDSVYANGPDEAREQYGDFWGETVTKTDRLLREMDAAGHPAIRGGERIARALRLAFAKTLPPMQMARAVVVALPDDPERFSAGLAEIKSNMARAFDVLDQDIIAWRARMERTLSDKVRAAFYNAAPTCRAL
jgi:hypothetical protein